MGTNTKKNQLTNWNLILQTNYIETQTKKSVLDFSTIIADVIFSVLMASQDEVDRVCQEREVALGRVLLGWEREIIKAYLFNEQLKSATPEERISIDNYKKVISFRLGTIPSLTSPWKRWALMQEFACATWREGGVLTRTSSHERGQPYLTLSERPRSRKFIVNAQWWWSWRHKSFGRSCLCWQGLSFTGARSRGGRSETWSPCWPNGAPSSGMSFFVCFL